MTGFTGATASPGWRRCPPWDTRLAQGGKGLDGKGEGSGQNPAGVEEVAGNKHEIDLLPHRRCRHLGKDGKKIPVTGRLTRRVAVGLAEMDICGVEKAHTPTCG